MDLADFFVGNAIFPIQERNAKVPRVGLAPAASAAGTPLTPPRQRPSFPNSPLKRAPTHAAVMLDSDSSSTDSFDSEDIADARPARAALQPPSPIRTAQPGRAQPRNPSGGLPITTSCISLAEPGADSSAQLTLAIIEDALRVPDIRPGALQLFEALAIRAGTPPPKPSSLSSGTFLARVHTPLSSPGGRWTMAAPSYTFARRKDLSCASVVQFLVATISPTSAQSVDITLDNARCSELASSSGVYGWAELWALAGARLVRELWEPFLSATPPPSASATDLCDLLWGATGLFLANVTQPVAFCDDPGAQRLLSVTLMTLAATKALQETMTEAPDKAYGLLISWLSSLHDKARLPMWISQEQATKAALQAHAAQAPPQAVAGSTIRSNKLRPATPRKLAADDPSMFKWCSSCSSPTHSLRDCFSVIGRLKGAASRGQDTTKLISKLIKDYKAKWVKKGPAFASFYNANPPCSLNFLQDRIAE